LARQAKVALDNAQALKEQSQGILEPGNLFLLYVGMVLTKTVHEFGHAFACRRFGGEVHTMGIMFMIFTPMPYVDADIVLVVPEPLASCAGRLRRDDQ